MLRIGETQTSTRTARYEREGRDGLYRSSGQQAGRAGLSGYQTPLGGRGGGHGVGRGLALAQQLRLLWIRPTWRILEAIAHTGDRK
jgi:hypothetical protein